MSEGARSFGSRVRCAGGYLWAALALPVVLATFFGMEGFARGFVGMTGLRISPWFSGGEISREVDHGTYRTLIHEPVFQGLLGERRNGFVQVDWKPAEGSTLPDSIGEAIDLDGDGAADCRVGFRNVPTPAGHAGSERASAAGTALSPVRLTPFHSGVLGLREDLRYEGWRSIRINLRRRVL
jgi:hypothetical protein